MSFIKLIVVRTQFKIQIQFHELKLIFDFQQTAIRFSLKNYLFLEVFTVRIPLKLITFVILLNETFKTHV